ncbi:hypothetical protein, partial [Burkholderia multivorans]|uniref:hypothetical protein n=1 Tax=Burkholderia multivorans TaxID=87883 RepID=UPI002011F6F3
MATPVRVHLYPTIAARPLDLYHCGRNAFRVKPRLTCLRQIVQPMFCLWAVARREIQQHDERQDAQDQCDD